MDKIDNICVEPSSFRDPSGFIFYKDGLLYRQINYIYKNNYDYLISSGLYKTLINENLLIPHEEIETNILNSKKAYKIIKPDLIEFKSYPYEWCFSQLKDAALTTLKIQKIAMDFGMTLKDCSSYNIQFKKGKAIFIDTLSFEKYREGQYWVAYKQACQHFIAPLVLMKYKDIRLSQLLRIYIDGIPLDLTSSLLPAKTYFNLAILSHIHLHAKSQTHFASSNINVGNRKISRLAFNGIIDSLESLIKKMSWRAVGTEWADYYNNSNYSKKAIDHKKDIITEFLKKINCKNVWDLGANDGFFSRVASNMGIKTISFDIDPVAVEKNYCKSIKYGEENVLPLLIDLTNPSPGIGWGNSERTSLIQRGPVETVFVLALIHHLAISNNLPFEKIASFLYSICKFLVIEFIPKKDSQVQKLLSSREDIFNNYNRQNFEDVFEKYFFINNKINVEDSERIIYLMKKRVSKI